MTCIAVAPRAALLRDLLPPAVRDTIAWDSLDREHQSSCDPTLAQRMLAYQMQIWARFRKDRPRDRFSPVLAVLVSHVPGGWTAPCAFEELVDPAVLELPGLAPLLPRCSMVTMDLAQRSQ